MRGSRCLACLIPSLLLAFGVIGTAKANVPPLRLVRTLANPGAIDGDQFGYSVAFAGARLLVGARFADLGGTNTGRRVPVRCAGNAAADPPAAVAGGGGLVRELSGGGRG